MATSPVVPQLSPSSRLAAGSPLSGVTLRRLLPHRDERGTFVEMFQETWSAGIHPIQWSVVESQPNVLRGLHLHRRHDEYFALIKGRVSVGLHDLRPSSTTRGQSSLYELTSEDPACLVFPAGILHGWYFPEESIHLQAVSESHDDYADDDNHGCHWSDPALGIPWPCTAPILSPRAAGFPSLKELQTALGDREAPE